MLEWMTHFSAWHFFGQKPKFSCNFLKKRRRFWVRFWPLLQYLVHILKLWVSSWIQTLTKRISILAEKMSLCARRTIKRAKWSKGKSMRVKASQRESTRGVNQSPQVHQLKFWELGNHHLNPWCIHSNKLPHFTSFHTRTLREAFQSKTQQNLGISPNRGGGRRKIKKVPSFSWE